MKINKLIVPDLGTIGRLGEEKRWEGTCASPESALCVVLKDSSTMSPANPGIAVNVPGTETVLAGAEEVETRGTSDNALGIEVLFAKN